MPKCYICQRDITNENASEEHIFLNAIGGRLKSRDLICRQCNDVFGSGIDSALAAQLNYLANMFNIRHDRGGRPQPMVVYSKKLNREMICLPGGVYQFKDPEVDIINSNDVPKGTINARSRRELRVILKGLKRKYPNFSPDIDSMVDNALAVHYDLGEVSTPISGGGDEVLRCVCKTAVNFLLMKDRNMESYVAHLFHYIRNGEGDKCVAFYYPEEDIFAPLDNEVLHAILVKGSKADRLLYAYVQFFNAYKYAVILNADYNGNDFKECYSFDVIARKEVKKEVVFFTAAGELISLLDRTSPPMTEITSAIVKVMAMAIDKQSCNYPN